MSPPSPEERAVVEAARGVLDEANKRLAPERISIYGDAPINKLQRAMLRLDALERARSEGKEVNNQ